MSETPEEKFERISRAVQNSILVNYPNPERRGCPGDDVVRRVAARRELTTDALWEHITHCSPCYAIFLSFKNEFRKRRAGRRRAFLTTGAAIVAAIPIIIVTRYRDASKNTTDVVGVWNLEDTSTNRGTEGSVQPSTAQRASRSKGHISVRLPLGSDEGEYRFELRKTENGPAIKTSQGSAVIAGGHTVLSIPVDFINLQPGSYFAAIGRGSHMWRVYPLILR